MFIVSALNNMKTLSVIEVEQEDFNANHQKSVASRGKKRAFSSETATWVEK